MNYYKLIQNALSVLNEKDRYAYFYGAKGQILTDDVMDTLIRLETGYFSRYDENTLNQIKDYSRNKIGLDCSGFITDISGIVGYSIGMYEKCPIKTTPRLGVEGSLLFTTFNNTGRHVGIDIGYGYFLHFPKELHSCEIGKISEYPWEHSGTLEGIDYTNAKR